MFLTVAITAGWFPKHQLNVEISRWRILYLMLVQMSTLWLAIEGHIALQAAAKHGHFEIVGIRLHASAEVNVPARKVKRQNRTSSACTQEFYRAKSVQIPLNSGAILRLHRIRGKAQEYSRLLYSRVTVRQFKFYQRQERVITILLRAKKKKGTNPARQKCETSDKTTIRSRCGRGFIKSIDLIW
jgi:hypothetical protein